MDGVWNIPIAEVLPNLAANRILIARRIPEHRDVPAVQVLREDRASDVIHARVPALLPDLPLSVRSALEVLHHPVRTRRVPRMTVRAAARVERVAV